MCALAQLVDNPADATVFLPRLLPGVERVSQEVSDPECRSVANTAYNTLVRVGAEGSAQGEDLKSLVQDRASILSVITRVVGTVLGGEDLTGGVKLAVEYVTELCHQLVAVRGFEAATWEQVRHTECCACLLVFTWCSGM